ncbi:DNA-binding transcriptional LysR family regulator [Pseudomonas sp. JAI115]|uniref:LysR family transcriptional regulator n=1 Tax=Pseudomonas sp. JAI115 TaxID=2723061 RepID=UPI001610738B|nr:LysR family transcriptional regulator [Pseudomonas sp. JAI115]MBB6158497.1 DNA-binding transcriptional LysR family regulator [Pseudomonas sp. JAI115]
MLRTVSELDIRWIRTFLSIVEAGGLSAAQATLNSQQPAISAQLKKLEERVGFDLCKRGRSGFSLTPEGERFVEAARRLVAATEDFQMEVNDIAQQATGIIHIGLIGEIDPQATEKIAQVFASLRTRFQGVRIALTELPPALLAEGVLNGSIDLAIGYFWQKLPALDYEPLFKETQIAYCSASHPLFEQAGALLRNDFGQSEWVWPSHPLKEMSPPTGLDTVTARTDSMDSAALLILSGQHLGFLPQHYATKYEHLNQLRALNAEQWRYEVDFQVVVRQASRHWEVISVLLAELSNTFSSERVQSEQDAFCAISK